MNKQQLDAAASGYGSDKSELPANIGYGYLANGVRLLPIRRSRKASKATEACKLSFWIPFTEVAIAGGVLKLP